MWIHTFNIDFSKTGGNKPNCFTRRLVGVHAYCIHIWLRVINLNSKDCINHVEPLNVPFMYVQWNNYIWSVLILRFCESQPFLRVLNFAIPKYLPIDLTIIRLIIERTCVQSVYAQDNTRLIHSNAFVKSNYAVRFHLMFVQL